MSHRTPIYVGMIDVRWPLESEQFAGARNALRAAFALQHIKPACGELACRPRRADGRSANVANRAYAIWANGVNNVIDMCHASILATFLPILKTYFSACDKNIVKG